MKHHAQILVPVSALLVLLGAPMAWAQQQQMPVPEAQQQAPVDPILQLNLSPEQREKIRTIREQTNAERVAVKQRLRETNQALEAALDADNPDEAMAPTTPEVAAMPLPHTSFTSAFCGSVRPQASVTSGESGASRNRRNLSWSLPSFATSSGPTPA